MTFILRYLLFVGVPYTIALKIEKRFWQHRRLEEKNNPEIGNEAKPNAETEPLNVKGGFTEPVSWVAAFILKDFAIKVAIVSAVGVSIWQEAADQAVQSAVKYAGPIIAAPGKKVWHLANKIRGVDSQLQDSVKEIVFNQNLTVGEKAELLRIKVEYAIKNMKGAKRIQFLTFVLAIAIFFFGKSFPFVAWVMERLRALIGHDEEVEDVAKYLIEVYREYNAPLPRELAEAIQDLK